MIFPQIKYGDVWLNNSTPEIEAWIDQNIPLDSVLVDSPFRSYVPIARQAAKPMPKPRIGSVYWPSGADRFAVGYFLVSVRTVRLIFPGTYRPTPKPLLIGQTSEDSLFRVVLPKMYALPPIGLSVFGGTMDAYLLVLVDERYYWRWKVWTPGCISYMGFPNGNGTGFGHTMPWSDFTGTCAGQLTISVETPTAIESQHKEANIASMTGVRTRYGGDGLRTVPEIFEAGMISVGRTIVSDYITGKYSLQTQDDADAIIGDNLEDFGTDHRRCGINTMEAGGESTNPDGSTGGAAFAITRQGIMPQGVDVLFPCIHHLTGLPFEGVSPGDTRFYRKSIDLDGLDIFEGQEGVSGFVHTIQDSYPLIIDCSGDAAEKKNQTDVDALAMEIAKNFYQQFLHSLDIVYNGPCKIKPCGAYDTIEWHLSHKDCYTRVRSAPWNSDYCLTHHGSKLDTAYPGIKGPLREFLIGTLTEDLEQGDLALCDVAFSDTDTRRILVEDEFNTDEETLPEGTKVGLTMDRHIGEYAADSGDPDFPTRYLTPRYVVTVAKCPPTEE